MAAVRPRASSDVRSVRPEQHGRAAAHGHRRQRAPVAWSGRARQRRERVPADGSTRIARGARSSAGCRSAPTASAVSRRGFADFSRLVEIRSALPVGVSRDDGPRHRAGADHRVGRAARCWTCINRRRPTASAPRRSSSARPRSPAALARHRQHAARLAARSQRHPASARLRVPDAIRRRRAAA